VRRRALVHHDGVDAGDGDDGGKMRRIGVRRQDDDAARRLWSETARLIGEGKAGI